MRVVDINRILGPVPHDEVPGRDADGMRAELDRLRIDEAWVVHSHAVYGDPLTVPPVEEDRLVAVPVVIPGPLGTGSRRPRRWYGSTRRRTASRSVTTGATRTTTVTTALTTAPGCSNCWASGAP